MPSSLASALSPSLPPSRDRRRGSIEPFGRRGSLHWPRRLSPPQPPNVRTAIRTISKIDIRCQSGRPARPGGLSPMDATDSNNAEPGIGRDKEGVEEGGREGGMLRGKQGGSRRPSNRLRPTLFVRWNQSVQFDGHPSASVQHSTESAQYSTEQWSIRRMKWLRNASRLI